MKKKILIIVSITCFIYTTKAYTQTDTSYYLNGNIKRISVNKNSVDKSTYFYDYKEDKCFKTITYFKFNKSIHKIYRDSNFNEFIHINKRYILSNEVSNDRYYLFAVLKCKGNIDENEPNYNSCKCKQMSYFPNGNMSEQGTIIKTSKDGKWKSCYTEGNIANVRTYRMDTLHGKWKTFYENGNQMNKGRYKNHIRVGIWREYYNNGNLKTKGRYLNSKNPILITRNNIDSIQSIYPALFSNTQLYFKDFLELKSGKWQYFNEEGDLTKEEFYEKGHLINTIDF